MERVTLDDRASGEPLVLIHGLATTRVIWRHVLPRLSEGRRVITLDVPGFGESPPAGEGFDLDEVASRIAAGLQRALPNCGAWFNPGEGHFFFRRKAREILGALSDSSAMMPTRNRA